MAEWLAIALAGALGGLVASMILRLGVDVPFPATMTAYLEERPLSAFLLNVVRSTILGGIASLILWGLYNPGASFASFAVTPLQFASAFVVGGGGVGIVDGLFRQAEQKRTIDDQADTIIKLADAVEEAVEDEESE